MAGAVPTGVAHHGLRKVHASCWQIAGLQFAGGLDHICALKCCLNLFSMSMKIAGTGHKAVLGGPLFLGKEVLSGLQALPLPSIGPLDVAGAVFQLF